MRGCFIAFEGANGVGKSTIISSIYNKLLQEHLEVFLTKEPSESEMGLLSRKVADHIEGKSLACLVAADRFFHVENVIIPELNKGKIVLCDRNILSAFVFNKMDNISFDYTQKLYEGLLYPDAIILFHACPETVHKRLLQREMLTRYEKESIGFEQQVIQESVAFLGKSNIKIFNVSTECSIEESVSRTYDTLIKYINDRLNKL